MDHIPLPKNPTWGRIDIPCITEDDYDGGNYETYPARQGYVDRTLHEWADFFLAPPVGYDSFMQRWRYFGFVASVLRIPGVSRPKLEDLTRRSPGKELYLDTSRLVDLVKKSIAGFRRSPSGAEDFKERLSSAQRFFQTIEASHNVEVVRTTGLRHFPEKVSLAVALENMPAADPLHLSVKFSIALMHEFLGKFIVCLPLCYERGGQVSEGDYQYRPPSSVLGACSSDQYPCLEHMREAGWCPVRLQELRGTMPMSGMLYIANMEPPDENDHRSCSDKLCRFTKTDNNTYETLHAQGCIGCDHVEPELDQLDSILIKGSYPVLSLASNISQARIALQDYSTDTPYVAISHVWSDGLGNPHRNSIPRCQYILLSNTVRKVAEKFPETGVSAFWLDTICCPLEDGSRIQNMALHKMKETYQNAEVVVVLDSYMLQQKMGDITDIEILMKLLCSKWTFRPWQVRMTYQEGISAKRVLLQLADGFYDLNEGYKRLGPSKPDLKLVLTLQNCVIPRIKNLLFASTNGTQRHTSFKSAVSALQYRSTSVRSDEPLCLSNLLGLDIEGILRADPPMRMVEFWRMQEKVPMGVVFYRGEKLHFPGFRWAPKSFLRYDADAKISDFPFSNNTTGSGEAEPSEKGLRFSCRGFDLRLTYTVSVRNGIPFRTGNGKWYKVAAVSDVTHWNPPTPPSGAKAELMLISDQHDTEVAKEDMSRRGRAHGILVYKKEGISNNIFNVGFIGSVEFCEPTKDRLDVCLKSYEHSDYRNTICYDAKELGNETEWCLD
ncbi:hypothetical protein HBI24_056980 [Parastagonospora nodorum]|nr:hypothetical protein HBI52_048100 [Parastagonospora nodorum]KAH5588682.1 hypothetical protein HBI24_056980 [Parastagonospora nodorum]